MDDDIERSFQVLQNKTGNAHESTIPEAIKENLKCSGKDDVMMFPHVSPIPANEYEGNIHLFSKAFPWLFPGGQGDITSDELSEMHMEKWMHHMLHYDDRRFAADKMWSFFALNYALRKQNKNQGGYFVKGFSLVDHNP